MSHNTDFLHTALLAWYDRCKRDLPWRVKGHAQPDPYKIWLSEIMLQQTTVQTVKGYFHRFINRWPTVSDLAASPLDDVLGEWAGLGYYARARNLHKCAKTVAENHAGNFPQAINILKTLPGIGDYTANAVAAIAFQRPAVVVDGNIERIVSRLFRIQDALPKARKKIKEYAAITSPKSEDGRHGDYAQAMMDLGATVCTPKTPKCTLCPIQDWCQALLANDAQKYPVKAPKKIKPVRKTTAYLVMYDGHILTERRPENGLLGGTLGLYTSPWLEKDDSRSNDIETIHDRYAPILANWCTSSHVSKHTFTHFHLITSVKTAHLSHKPNLAPTADINPANSVWHPLDRLDKLPTVFQKMVKTGLA